MSGSGKDGSGKGGSGKEEGRPGNPDGKDSKEGKTPPGKSGGPGGGGNSGGPGNFQFDPNNRTALIFLAGLIFVSGLVFLLGENAGRKQMPYTTFLHYVEEGRINQVIIYDGREIEGTYQDPAIEGGVPYVTTIPYYDEDLIPLLQENKVQVTGKSRGITPGRVFLELLPWIIAFGLIFYMFRQMQGGGNKAFSFGKSKAKEYEPTGSKTTFGDVAGQEEAKYELEEVVEFLKSPERFTRIGAKIPKGVLLVGMPGTGKTLLAKAVAGEAGVSFFHMSGSDFVEMFVGVGASRVRDLFEQGRKNAPCILFIDELDAVGRTRGAGYGGGHDEREQTLNQMLVEMDGFDTKDGVIMIAATNRPDVLDPALLRPGRFDRQVVVDMPDIKERTAILKIHGQKIQLDKDVEMDRVARATPGSSGADLANVVNEAALFAARQHRESVTMEDFEEARDKILMGAARKSRVITTKEKRMTAYHEGGHALLHYYLKDADPLHKVTIVPRGRALGVAFSLPEEDTYSRSSGWLLDRIKIAYGGYAAEEMIYGQTTTGAKNDIEQATSMARKMVCEYGMSRRLGPVSLGQGDEPIFIGKEIAQHKDYAESTASVIDQEIHAILENALAAVRGILSKHREQLETLAEGLFKRETMTDDEVRELLGFAPRMRGEDANETMDPTENKD